MMKILIFGAGGIGGYFGGRLVQAGADVTLIARGRHLVTLQENGLKLESAAGDVHIPSVQATDKPADVGPVDVVLMCVKMDQLADALDTLKPVLNPSTLIVPLQNGVDAPRMIVDRWGREHAGVGLCAIISYVTAPGVIRHETGQPMIRLGEIDNRGTERIYQLHKVLDGAPGMGGEIPTDVWVSLWRKFILFAAAAGMGALTRVPVDVFRSVPETRVMLHAMMRETTAVGQAHGIRLSAEDTARALKFVDRLAAGGTTSMQRDVMAGRPSELHFQSGAVVRLGQEVGVPTPTHEFVYHALLPQEREARGEG